MTVRERTEEIERMTLSPYASLSENSRGREKPEEECPVRTCYQRDRDRVIHCKAFRRLKQKTQVFLSTGGRSLQNATDTYAGGQPDCPDHCPCAAPESGGFDRGHRAGARFGTYAVRPCRRTGAEPFVPGRVQALRAKRACGDLSGKRRQGPESDMGSAQRHCVPYQRGLGGYAEGQIVRYADHIAYMNHDIEDAVEAGVLRNEDLPKEITRVLGDTKSQRITTMICSMIDHGAETIGMDSEVAGAYEALHDFMYSTVYVDRVAKREEKKGGQAH